jgi:hypothetical protein
MNANFLAIIKKIISEQGEAILADPQRLKGWISDYAKDEPKAERLAFGRCIEYGAYGELKNTPAESRAAAKNRLVQRLHSEEGLDTAICTGALDLLEAALFGVPEQKITCRNCGKELQAEWKTCPYCGASLADVYTSLPASAPSSSPGVGYGIGLIEPKPATRRKKRTPAVHRDKIESPPSVSPATTVNAPETSPVSESEKKGDSPWSWIITGVVMWLCLTFLPELSDEYLGFIFGLFPDDGIWIAVSSVIAGGVPLLIIHWIVKKIIGKK